MRAVIIESFGDASGLSVVDLPAPEPGAGRMLVRTEAIGVGGVDAVIRRGTLGTGAFRPGHVPGSEVAGVVIGVGDGVDESWLGRRVWAFTGVGGGYAEQVVAALDDVTPLPAGLSPVDAVTLGSAGPVAHFALAHAHLAAGESVLVRGGAGSIGITAVQLAVAAGAATVAVTTSSAERGDRLRAVGADVVLDRSGAEVLGAGAAAAMRGLTTAGVTGTRAAASTDGPTTAGVADAGAAAATGDLTTTGGAGASAAASTDSRTPAAGAGAGAAPRDFDVIIDVVGGDQLPQFIDLLAPGGRYVLVGVVAGYPPADFGLTLMRSFQRSLSFATFSLNTVPIAERNRVRSDQFALAARGELTPVVHAVLPLAEAADAHRRMDAGEVFGRIVLIP